jgi:glycosyltransferase involved in cell wall biosynthesis
MKNKPIISILVPIYNAEKYLGKCLESIISQSYENLEIILVDDGSTDNSHAICKALADGDNRIKLCSQTNQGIHKTRGVLMNKISGDFFSFVDADDYLEPKAIEILVMLILENDADLAKGSFRIVNLETIEIAPHITSSNMFNNYEYMEFLLKGNWSLWGSLVRYNKKHIQQLTFDENVAIGEDLMICAHLALNIEKAIISDEIVYNYRKGGESAMGLTDRKRFLSHQFLSIFYTFKELKAYLKYEDLVLNLITPAVYSYVCFFNKNRHHGELKQMTRFLSENKKKVRGRQFKFILSTLKFSYSLSHLFVFFMQKIKPTIKIFNSNINA